MTRPEPAAISTGKPSTDSFGALLRSLRQDAGVSLAELARQINYSKSQVSKIENGLKHPTSMFARNCDHALGTNGALASLAASRQQLSAVVNVPVTAHLGEPSLDARLDVGARRAALAMSPPRTRSDRVAVLVGAGVPAFGAFSAAAEAAARARTTREFAAACNQLLAEKGLSQGGVARRAGHRLPKSTVNRMVTGTSLCQTPDQVLALLEACDASHEAEAWLQGWNEARKNKRRRPFTESTHSPTETPAEASVETSDDTDSVRAADELEPEYISEVGEDVADEDVLLELRVRVTRQHVRNALPVLAAMGLLTAADDEALGQLTPGTLMTAAGMALIDDGRRILARQRIPADKDGQNPGPQGLRVVR